MADSPKCGFEIPISDDVPSLPCPDPVVGKVRIRDQVTGLTSEIDACDLHQRQHNRRAASRRRTRSHQ